MSFLIVALGGALGSVARYSISLIPVRSTFPILTLITNAVGSIMIGFVVGLATQSENVSQNLVLFLKTGVCGGWTTFSTFSLEAFDLYKQGQNVVGTLYIILSVVCCLVGVWCGKKLAVLFC